MIWQESPAFHLGRLNWRKKDKALQAPRARSGKLSKVTILDTDVRRERLQVGLDLPQVLLVGVRLVRVGSVHDREGVLLLGVRLTLRRQRHLVGRRRRRQERDVCGWTSPKLVRFSGPEFSFVRCHSCTG